MESGDWSKAGEPKIAYLVGGDDHTSIVRDSSRIDVVGSTDIYLLRVRGPSDFARLHVTKGYFRQPQRYTLDTYDVLLNLRARHREDAKRGPRLPGCRSTKGGFGAAIVTGRAEQCVGGRVIVVEIEPAERGAERP